MQENKEYINTINSQQTDLVDIDNLFCNYIYDNYIYKFNKDKIFLKIGDLGCGNCIDSTFFANKGNYVIAIDPVGCLEIPNQNINFILSDIEEEITGNKLETLLDVVYIKELFKTISYEKAENIFKKSLQNLKPNGILCIEDNVINDKEINKNNICNTEYESYSKNHTIFLYTKERVTKLAQENDLEILDLSEYYNNSNNLLLRFVCRKKLKNYYNLSPNYYLYKNNLDIVKERCEKAYFRLNELNKIFEEYDITYVAISGSILGLNRHGGLVPWDYDIDIGFIKSEWTKLLKITHLLNTDNYKFKKTTFYCNYDNLIDCHLLDEKNEWFRGIGKTFCHEEEYKTNCKQIFGYTYIYAPFCSKKTLVKNFGVSYFNKCIINNNSFKYKTKDKITFNIHYNDLSFQIFEKLDQETENKNKENNIIEYNNKNPIALRFVKPKKNNAIFTKND